MTTDAPEKAPALQPLALGRRMPKVGDIVLVRLDVEVVRPMLISRAGPTEIHDGLISTQVIGLAFRVSGTIFCEPEDHSTPVLRQPAFPAGDPARITGRPDRHTPYVYAEHLAPGPNLAQWTLKE